jgi:hypothetical protein
MEHIKDIETYLTEASASAMIRMNNITSRKDIDKLKSVISSIASNLYADGFDADDIVDYIVKIANSEARIWSERGSES